MGQRQRKREEVTGEHHPRHSVLGPGRQASGIGRHGIANFELFRKPSALYTEEALHIF